MHAKPGDKVKFTLTREIVEGTLLESHDPTVYLVKLSSGYNIGVLKEHVKQTRILKKASTEETSFALPTPKKGLKTVGMIVTGGTIASKLDPTTGAVKPLTNTAEFAHFYPELFEKVNVKKIVNPFMALSENMSSEHWVKIAEETKKLLEDKDIEGVIITHGTDFLHYTGAAVSFFLGPVNKPVVLTYSQRSVDRGSSDARLNLLCAAEMAISECAEVMLVGHATTHDTHCYALRATKTRKMHSSRRDTFKPINTRPIAKVWPTKIEYLSEYRVKDAQRKLAFDASYTDKVALVKFYPGQKPDILDYYHEKGYHGVVIEVSGLGHMPAHEAKHSWVPTIKRLKKQGFIVCAAAQTLHGRLHPLVYSPGRELMAAGVMYLEDMLPETALVKLGWVLGHRQWRTHDKAHEKMIQNVVGEFSTYINE